MIDEFHLLSRYKSNVKIFTPNVGVDAKGMQTWQKPRGASMVMMICIAGGGGGGGGNAAASGNFRSGGGGGASSGVARFLCPALFLPDTLFVQCGVGGKGGAGDANGSPGINSYVLTTPRVQTLPNIICYSGVNAPGGGQAGQTTTGGTGGTVPTIAVTQPFNSMGEWFAIVGVVGAAGGNSDVAGSSITAAWNGGTPMTTPGAGGGGCTSSNKDGGSVTATDITDLVNSGYYSTGTGAVAAAGTGTGAAINGSAGAYRLTPFFNSGGAGGAGVNSSAGGSGGHGGYGSGGGGGGGGTSAGRGGNGGPGLVVIISW